MSTYGYSKTDASPITARLFALQDVPYRNFQSKLIPGVAPEAFIGVRTPALRALAKEIARGDVESFLEALPHFYFDENQLHAFILSEMKDYDACMTEVCRFLPYVDNWATCDQLTPKVFARHKPQLLLQVRDWLGMAEVTADTSEVSAAADMRELPVAAERTYTVRFAIRMLMDHFLGDDFAPEYPALVAAVRSDEYYVNMMRAWYFATALAKQWDAVIPYITEERLDYWTHNKTIQKAVESYRITDEQKEFLRSFRRKAR